MTSDRVINLSETKETLNSLSNLEREEKSGRDHNTRY